MNKTEISKHTACDDMARILLREKGMYCCFAVMTEDIRNSHQFPELIRDHNGALLIDGDEYVIVTCGNGYRYYINVTGDSVITMCAEVFNFIQNK